MPSYKLTYFNAKMRPEICRYLFVAAGADFEDVSISPKQFWDLKTSGKLPLGQVPILEMDDRVITQGRAIQRYLARKFGFYGNGIEDELVIDEVCEVVDDVLDLSLPWVYRELDEEKREALKTEYWEERGPRLLTFLEKKLAGSNTGYFVGNQMTVADIAVFNIIDIFQDLVTEKRLEPYPKLLELTAKVAKNERIARYLDSRKVVALRQVYLNNLALQAEQAAK